MTFLIYMKIWITMSYNALNVKYEGKFTPFNKRWDYFDEEGYSSFGYFRQSLTSMMPFLGVSVQHIIVICISLMVSELVCLCLI